MHPTCGILLRGIPLFNNSAVGQQEPSFSAARFVDPDHQYLLDHPTPEHRSTTEAAPGFGVDHDVASPELRTDAVTPRNAAFLPQPFRAHGAFRHGPQGVNLPAEPAG